MVGWWFDRLQYPHRHDHDTQIVVFQVDRSRFARELQRDLVTAETRYCVQQIPYVHTDRVTRLPALTGNDPFHGAVLGGFQPHPDARRYPREGDAELPLWRTGDTGLQRLQQGNPGHEDRGALFGMLQEREVLRKLSLDEPRPQLHTGSTTVQEPGLL